jgi:Sulfatase
MPRWAPGFTVAASDSDILLAPRVDESTRCDPNHTTESECQVSDETIDRTKLPIRRPPFSGVAEQTLGGSRPDWEQIGHVRPPQGAPNVLVVLIDDAGFGNPGAFGGPIDTPNYDRIADQGLRYNRFHVTAMCSPTRAALLTGRNHHAVGMGGIPEASSGFPGYSAQLPMDAA